MNSVINPDSGPKITLKKNLYDVLLLWQITYKSKTTPAKTVHSGRDFYNIWQNSGTFFRIFVYFQVFEEEEKRPPSWKIECHQTTLFEN